MAGMNTTQTPTTYLDLYKYLLVLTEGQIIKLRNVAQFRERAATLEAEARRRAHGSPLSAGGAQA